MHTSPVYQQWKKQQGSTIMVAAAVIVLVAGAVATSMLRSQSASLLVQHSGVNAELRSVAEGEMERIYFLWKRMQSQQEIPAEWLGESVGSSIPTQLTPTQIEDYLETCPTTGNPGLNSAVDLETFNLGRDWDDSGTAKYRVEAGEEIDDALIPGASTGTTTRGSLTTYEVTVWVSKAARGSEKSLGLRRQFTVAKSATFQNAIFYNGTMELTPGGTTRIQGDISCNSDIYLGGKRNSGEGIFAYGKVASYGNLNGNPTGLTDSWFNALRQTDSYTSPNFLSPTSRASQVGRLTEAQSFLDGLDVEKIWRDTPELFTSANDVNHAIIDPPPASGNDNDEIKSQRMYNKAGIRVQVKTVGGTPRVIVTAGNQDVSSKFTSVFPASKIRKLVYDARETENVAITTIDVKAFTDVILADASLKAKFNGVLYAYDSDSGKSAIRLTEGAAIPKFNATTTNPGGSGFTVATNSGLYIEGDYNTAVDTSDGKINRCVVMADAVTGLSNSWSDDRATLLNPLTGEPFTVWDRAASDTEYNTAIITGDVAQVVSGSTLTSSGGPHNLLRLLESWNGKTLTIKGSLVQLFNSKTFDGEWVNNGYYKLPTNRYILFDSELSENPPDGFVMTTQTTRGGYSVVY